MDQNVVVCLFEVESEAFQALSELRRDPGNEKSFVAQAVVVRKENGVVSLVDGFDTGVATRNDTVFGGVVGALVGVLGGPIGILLGGSYGALVGSALDSADAVNSACMIEQIAGKLVDGEVALIALAAEEDEAVLDEKLNKFQGIIARFDAAAVAEEVEEAQLMAKEMARQAVMKLRGEKKASIKEKLAARRAKISADCEAIWAQYNKEQPPAAQTADGPKPDSVTDEKLDGVAGGYGDGYGDLIRTGDGNYEFWFECSSCGYRELVHRGNESMACNISGTWVCPCGHFERAFVLSCGTNNGLYVRYPMP